MVRVVFPTLLAFVLALPARAVDETVLTFDAVIARAWNEAPAVSSAEASAHVARTRIDVAAAAALPSLDGSVSANGNFKNSNTIFDGTTTAPGGNAAAALGYKGVVFSSGVNAGLGASWLLLDFGRTSENVRAASLSANASDSDVDSARANAATAAGTAFLALAGDLQLVEARQKLVAENERLLEVAHGRVQSGVAAPIEEVRAKVAVETAKVDVLTAQAAAKNDAAALAISLGIDPNKPMQIGPPPELGVDDDPVKAADRAEQARPEIQSLKLRVDASEASLLSARSGRLPALAATANASVGPAYTTLVGAGGTFGEAAVVGATMSIPIFEPGVSADIASAEAETFVAKAALRQQLIDIRGQAAQAAIAVRSTAAAQSAADQLLAQADENYREAKGRYELGAAGLLELTDAETQESSATLSLIQARYQAAAARLRLMAAVGTLRPAPATPATATKP